MKDMTKLSMMIGGLCNAIVDLLRCECSRCTIDRTDTRKQMYDDSI